VPSVPAVEPLGEGHHVVAEGGSTFGREPARRGEGRTVVGQEEVGKRVGVGEPLGHGGSDGSDVDHVVS
jgi:hypothetical protein